jgi:hypothetical protein
MIKRLLLALALAAALLSSPMAASASSSAPSPKAEASAPTSESDVTPQVTSCGGHIGNPQWRNVGSFRNTIGVSWTNYVYVYPGSYVYYCPNWIYVHSGKDILVYCYYSGQTIGHKYFTAYGWNGIPSWMDSADRCDASEYNQ